MGEKKYDGVREGSRSTIEIDFYFRGQRCRERIQLKPTPINLKRASQHRAAILLAIDNGSFDYPTTFPNSKNADKFASHQYTLNKYTKEWLNNKKPTLKASTFNDYRKIMLNIICPKFGGLILAKITRSDIRTWVATLECSNKRIANILSPLRTALQDAYIDGLIDSNPLSGWTYKRNEPTTEKYHVDPFTASEQEAILSSTDGQLKNQIIVFFWTGVRTSELIALEWADIDWDRKKIKISRARTAASETHEKTKTSSGTREIDMLPHVEQALTNQKQYTLLTGKNIFNHPDTGKPWTGDQQIRKGFWMPLLKKAGVRYRNPYQTRHTFASMMLSAGENLAWVSAQMGHSNVLITAKTYAKWIQSDASHGGKAMDMFGQHLINAKSR